MTIAIGIVPASLFGTIFLVVFFASWSILAIAIVLLMIDDMMRR